MSSLRFRLTFWYTVVVSLTVILILAAGGIMLKREVIHSYDLLNSAELQEVVRRLPEKTVDLSSQDIKNALLDHVEKEGALFFFQIHRDTEGVIFRSPNLGPTTLPDNSPGPLFRTYTLAHLGTIREAEFYLDDLHIQIASPLNHANEVIRGYLKMSLILSVAVVLLSYLISKFLTSMALRPIRSIQSTANRITGHNLSERIPVSRSNDEISELAQFLNSMFERLENSFNQIKTFTSDASHELRTPLSLIRLQAEKLLKDNTLSGENREALAELVEEVVRLNKIIESLLVLARADSRVIQLEKQPRDIQQFITEFSEDADALAEDRNLKFELAQNDQGKVDLDASWLRHVILNIFSNSLKASPPKGRITLVSKIENSQWVITIEDEGPGVPEERLDHIFERFVMERKEDAGEESVGSGLGLAICRSIVELHGGHIYARNNEYRKGLSVTIMIPVGSD